MNLWSLKSQSLNATRYDRKVTSHFENWKTDKGIMGTPSNFLSFVNIDYLDGQKSNFTLFNHISRPSDWKVQFW